MKLVMKEEKNYRELKGSIRIMTNQRSDTKKTNLIEEPRKSRS